MKPLHVGGWNGNLASVGFGVAALNFLDLFASFWVKPKMKKVIRSKEKKSIFSKMFYQQGAFQEKRVITIDIRI